MVDRDLRERQLLKESEELREQLLAMVGRLDGYVEALRAEVGRIWEIRTGGDHAGP